MKVLRAGSIVGVVALAVSGVAVWAAQAAPNPARPGDFNGDGHRELVVSAPGDTGSGGTFGGYAGVFPGTADGPTRSGASRVKAAFTASGDFNGDGYADLARCSLGVNAEPHLVVLFGSRTGLGETVTPDDSTCSEPLLATDANGDRYSDLVVNTNDLMLLEGSAEATTPAGWTKSVIVPGGPGCEPGNDCDGVDSYSADIGDVNNDGRPDLAYQVSNNGDEGYADTQLWLGNGDGFTYASKVRTLAGGEVALGDTNGDGFDDLALSLPGAGVRDVRAAGYVRFWKGSASGIDLRSPWRVISQDTPGVPGVIEEADLFGESLAIGDVNGDGRAELAIGTPAEDAGTLRDAGSVTVLPGSPSGPNAAASVLLHQDTPGIPGAVEAKDLFGTGLAYNAYTDNGRAQLVVGSPIENGGEGIAHVITGLNKVTATVFTARAAGIAPEHARFGETTERSR